MTQMGPETAEDLEPIEGLLGVPFPQVFDFVEDAAVGASIGEDGAWVGVAGEVTDEEVASDRLQRVLGIVGAMASRDDSGIEVTEADVDGTTVTTITLPEEATEDMQVGGMPFAVESLSIAISDGTLLFGTGDFVTDALASDGSASLASSEGYTSAVGDVDAEPRPRLRRHRRGHDHARSAALLRHGRLGRRVAVGRWPRPVRRGRHGGRLGHLGAPHPLRGLSASERLYHAPGAARWRPASPARSA